MPEISHAVPGVISASLANGTLTLTPAYVEFTAPLRDTVTVSATVGTMTEKVDVIVDVTSCVTTASASFPQVELVAGGTLERSIADYFHNSETEALTYTAESSNVDTFTVSLSDEQMTLTGGALASGTSRAEAELNLTAKNSCGAAVDTVAVLVEEPTGPVVDVLLPDITLAVGDTVYIYLPDHFRSTGRLSLTYQTYLEDHSPNDDYVGVTQVGMQQDSLQIVGQHAHPAEGPDDSELRVVALDDDGSVSDTMDIRVTPTPPIIIKPIPDTTLVSGGASADYVLSEYFEDPDGAFDDLVFEVASNDDAVTTSIADGVLTVTPGTVTMEATATITVEAEDNDEQSVSTSFDVTVRTANGAPTCRDITVTLTVGDADEVFDMDDYCSDPDSDDLTYALGDPMGSAASVTLDDNDLTISPSEEGTTTATVTADDDNGNTATSSISVTVRAANVAPTCRDITVTLKVNDADEVFDMDDYCSDSDGDDLTYALGDPTGSAASVTLDDNDLTISPSEEGITTATVTADDDNGTTATSNISVTVVCSDPISSTIPNQHVLLRTDVDIALNDYFSDPNNGELSYTATQTGVLLTLDISDDNTLTIEPEIVGSATVDITAQRECGSTKTQSFEVTVRGTPVANGTIANRTLRVNGASVSFDVASYFTEPDGDDLTYSVSVDYPVVRGQTPDIVTA
ncbi:MAG: Ig-like domain-containing protein, partial [Bacteroidetes bacterium]|nr:Ig-like domain-containing protein [Bacteroidota bacterium]